MTALRNAVLLNSVIPNTGDMMLIILYWVKRSCSAMVMGVTSKPYVTNCATRYQNLAQVAERKKNHNDVMSCRSRELSDVAKMFSP